MAVLQDPTYSTIFNVYTKFERFYKNDKDPGHTMQQYIFSFQENYGQLISTGFPELPQEYLGLKIIQDAGMTDADIHAVLLGIDFNNKPKLFENAKSSLLRHCVQDVKIEKDELQNSFLLDEKPGFEFENRLGNYLDLPGKGIEEDTRPSIDSQNQITHDMQQSGDLDGSLVEIVPNPTGGDGYKCRVCEVFYPRKWHMKLHIRTHTGEKPYICDYENCGKSFSRPGNLSEHKKRNHEKVLDHECPICEKRFYGRSDMLIHIVIHDEARQQRERFLPSQMMNLLQEVEEFNFGGQLIRSNCVCGECGKIFDKRGGKERHIKNVHPEQYAASRKDDLPSLGVFSKNEESKFEANSADLKYEPNEPTEENEDYMIEQIKQEDALQPQGQIKKETADEEPNILELESQFSCDLCENVLSSKESLDIHKLIHSELNRFMCSEENCSEVFANQKSLKKHLKIVHKTEKKTDNRIFHVCQECGKQCSTKAGLQDHMLCHSKEKNFVCMECGKRLKRRDSLVQHMRMHTGEMKYQCDQCEARYVSSAALRNHTLSKHTETTDTPQFICSYCGKEFKKKDYLLKHITGHTGEKKYHCTVCEKKFRFETSLASHMDMHNGIKKFQCPYCEKRFTQRQQMNVHVRRHTGDKRHKCEICSEAFIEPRCLRNHIKRHHEINI